MSLYDETKFILKKYNISANKNLGQNFLINDDVVQNIIKSADINKDDLIIEIGPGLGTLTKELLNNAGKVIAIELDYRMISILNDRFKLYDNFEIINNDVLKVDLENIINNNLSNGLKKVKIVANLPYYITTPIIMKLLEDELNIDSITVMVQKEVADRLVEIPGGKNTGAITYSIYYYAETEKIMEVYPNCFIPEPTVNSEVIKFKIRDIPPIDVIDKKLMFDIIKHAFMQRRKTFVNALENCKIFSSKNDIVLMLEKLNIEKNIRGEKLSLEDYKNIANFVTKM